MTTEPLDPAAIMAEHEPVHECVGGTWLPGLGGPCPIYRLAAEVATLRAQVQRVRDALLQGGQTVAIRCHSALAALDDPTEPKQMQPEPPREVETVDLVAALRASVEAAKKRREAAQAERVRPCWPVTGRTDWCGEHDDAMGHTR